MKFYLGITTLFLSVVLAAVFENFNPLLRYKPLAQDTRSDLPNSTTKQTDRSIFLNANTTSE